MSLRSVGVLSWVLLSACATPEHRTLSPSLDSPVTAALAPLSCTLDPITVTDNRSKRRAYGMDKSVYRIDGLQQTVAEHLHAWQPNIALAINPPQALELSLLRAYSAAKSSLLFFHVVAAARLDGGEQQVLRGQHEVVNWTGSQGEVERAMSGAVDAMLTELHRWLELNCQSS